MKDEINIGQIAQTQCQGDRCEQRDALEKGNKTGK